MLEPISGHVPSWTASGDRCWVCRCTRGKSHLLCNLIEHGNTLGALWKQSLLGREPRCEANRVPVCGQQAAPRLTTPP